MFSLSPGWFPEGDEKEGDETSNSRQRWGLSSQLSTEVPLEETLTAGMATCRQWVRFHPALALPFFPRRSLVSVPGAWAVCDHLAVQALLMTPVGSRSWPGCGRGLPSAPLAWQEGSGTLALQRWELTFKQLLNFLFSVLLV